MNYLKYDKVSNCHFRNGSIVILEEVQYFRGRPIGQPQITIYLSSSIYHNRSVSKVTGGNFIIFGIIPSDYLLIFLFFK